MRIYRRFFWWIVLTALLVSAGPGVSQNGLGQLLGVDTAAEEEPAPEPANSSAPRDDTAIRQNLEDLLGRLDDLKEFSVDVTGGVATLSGEASTNRAITQARELSQKVEGVNMVINNIDETPDVGERIDPALARIGDRIEALWRQAPLLLLAIAIFAGFLALARLLGRFPGIFGIFSRKRLVQGIIQQIVSTVIVLVGLIVVLEILDATALVGAVFGAAGLIGLVLGFAFKDIGENYLASVIMGLHQPFSVNDLIRIEGYEGRVARLTTRETLLISVEGNHIRLPNALVFKSVIINYSRNPLRRLSFTVGIGVNESLSNAQKVGLEALRNTPGILEEPAPIATVHEFGEFTMDMEFAAWVDQEQADWGATQSEALRAVKRAFDKGGIEMPFPTRDLHIQRGEAESSRKLATPPEPESPPQDAGAPIEEPVRKAVEEEIRRDDEGENLLD